MSTKILFANGRVIDPLTGLDAVRDVLVVDGRVAAIGHDASKPDDAQVVDCAGLVVAPGFVDLHCHLREPGQEHKETLASGLAAAAAGGFTTVCCMPNTTPPLDTPGRVQWARERAASVSPVHLYVIAAITTEQAGERLAPLRELAEAGAVAFSDDGRPVWNDDVMRLALRGAGELGLPLSLHEEDRELAAGGVMNAGPVAARLGLRGLPAVAEERMIARDIALLAAEGGRARVHIAHVSTAGAVALVRDARRRGLPVSAEATPHHLTLTDDLVARPWDGRPYDTRAKVNPPLRTKEDVDAVVAGLLDGTIEAIATDHAPHGAADKRCPYEQAAFGISLFETALASVLTLYHERRAPLPVLIERLTAGPARLFGINAGTLTPGASADIVVFDPNEEWTVDAAAFRSKGKNTPLDGARLRGRVVMTLAEGAEAYRRETRG
ncbi:MAG: dihydroorotase [Chloroflexota bacterium]|nr:dihydroorotase [Chloroflexota bacterium]